MLDPDATVWICRNCKQEFITENKLFEHSGVHVGRHEKGVHYCPKKTEDGKPCKYMTDRIEKLNVHITEIHKS